MNEEEDVLFDLQQSDSESAKIIDTSTFEHPPPQEAVEVLVVCHAEQQFSDIRLRLDPSLKVADIKTRLQVLHVLKPEPKSQKLLLRGA